VIVSIYIYRDVISPECFDQLSILSELRCFKAQLAKTSWTHHADIRDDKDSLFNILEAYVLYTRPGHSRKVWREIVQSDLELTSDPRGRRVFDERVNERNGHMNFSNKVK